jgi:hypothetical protein
LLDEEVKPALVHFGQLRGITGDDRGATGRLVAERHPADDGVALRIFDDLVVKANFHGAFQQNKPDLAAFACPEQYNAGSEVRQVSRLRKPIRRIHPVSSIGSCLGHGGQADDLKWSIGDGFNR